MKLLDALYFTLGLDPSGVDKGMKEAESRISNGVKTIKSLVAPLVGAFAAKKLFGDYMNDVKVLEYVARRVKDNAQAVDAWGQALESTGGNAQSFQASLVSMHDTLRNAPYLLARYGISARDAANGGLKPMTAILEEVAGLSGKLHSRHFRRLGESLGLDHETIELLKTGKQSVQELIASMQETTYTQEDTKAVAEYNRQMSRTTSALRSVSAIAMRYLVPALTFVAEKVQSGTRIVREHEKFFLITILAITAALTARFIPAVWALAKAWLANPLTWVVVGLVAIIAVIDDLLTYMRGGESELSGFWALFGTGEELSQSLGKALAWLKDIGNDLLSTLRPYVPFMAKLLAGFMAFKGVAAVFGTAAKGIGLATNAVRLLSLAMMANPIVAAIAAIAAALVYCYHNFEWFRDGVDAIIEAVAGYIRGLVEDIKAVVDGIKEVAGKVSGTVSGWWDSAKDFVGLGSDEAAPMPGQVNSTTRSVQNNDTRVNTGPITINTQATDAEGIASGLGGAVRENMPKQLVRQSNGWRGG